MATFGEIVRKAQGAKIQAVIDGVGEYATVSIYQATKDDFEEDIVLDWPDDWPSSVSAKFLRERGIEVITA